MESTFDSLLLGFSVALRPDVLWYAFLGCLVGTLVGVLPGIGPLSGIRILLPVTFGLNATQAVIMLAGIYYGSQYGGSPTPILIGIPGADLPELGDGIGIVPVAVGLFGLGEILATPSTKIVGEVIAPKLRELLPNREEWRQSAMPIARGSLLGFIIGIIPGSAHIISSFLSYALEKRLSKTPEEFGNGAVA